MASKYALFKTKLNICKPNTATVIQKIINIYSLSPCAVSETQKLPAARRENSSLSDKLMSLTLLKFITNSE